MNGLLKPMKTWNPCNINGWKDKCTCQPWIHGPYIGLHEIFCPLPMHGSPFKSKKGKKEPM